MADVKSQEELSLPAPDLPTNDCANNYISLSAQSPKIDIKIRNVNYACNGNIQEQEMNINYTRLLQTFRDWPIRFLDPEVLAEASFIYYGVGDTARCVGCGGELSNWKPGDDPNFKHLHEFGFLCN